ncbi:hypothetical protein M758_11G161300 [Ceratodon purpureus]|uniref:Phosphatidylinositol N-acetylglucosaminyltransferase subunit Y n=1 Tax=Ceratodon purpureus TaxID=3225 RepID=A0A8T0GJK3_CERPU|nr:hypothetical protein KC19_11G165400 [Ceratodon purpureus]KAG0602112.1 hypothetical protein M758_11G161300 [Ceratodon purpureus]
MDGRPAPALFRLPSLARKSCAPPQLLLRWGLLLICIGVVGFGVVLYASLLSKLLPPSGAPFLDAVRRDWYYSLVVPLTGPVIVAAVYFHWLSMKLFKHA